MRQPAVLRARGANAARICFRALPAADELGIRRGQRQLAHSGFAVKQLGVRDPFFAHRADKAVLSLLLAYDVFEQFVCS